MGAWLLRRFWFGFIGFNLSPNSVSFINFQCKHRVQQYFVLYSIKNDESVVGRIYNYFDVVIQDYQSQDHVQAIEIVTAIIHKIQTMYPEIADFMIGSDNTSCLASHDSITYIHYLNKDLEAIKILKWVYTEATDLIHISIL